MAVDLAHDDLGFIGRADHERVLQIPRPVARERSCNRAKRRQEQQGQRPEERNLAHGDAVGPNDLQREERHPAPHRRHLQHRPELVRRPVVGSVAVQVVQAVGVGKQHPQRNAEDEQRQTVRRQASNRDLRAGESGAERGNVGHEEHAT